MYNNRELVINFDAFIGLLRRIVGELFELFHRTWEHLSPLGNNCIVTWRWMVVHH